MSRNLGKKYYQLIFFSFNHFFTQISSIRLLVLSLSNLLAIIDQWATNKPQRLPQPQQALRQSQQQQTQNSPPDVQLNHPALLSRWKHPELRNLQSEHFLCPPPPSAQ